jgi:hypothetical protein
MNKKRYSDMISYFASIGDGNKRNWLINQSINDLKILLYELHSKSTLNNIVVYWLNDAWSQYIDELIKTKRDEKLNDLGIHI